MAVGHERDVSASDMDLLGYSALHVSGQLRSVSVGVHISCGSEVYGDCLERTRYNRTNMEVKKKTRTVINISQQESLAQKVRALRASLHLKQADLAAICGVKQASVSKWESETVERRSVPTSKMLIKLSEIAPEADRQWWRDKAAEQAFDLEVGNSLGTYALPPALRMIPLLKTAKGMGNLSVLLSSDVERKIHFPAEWFPEGGTICAVRIHLPDHPEMIAMIDISRKDSDRLVGHLVAVQTAEGVEVRWLSLEDGVYMLLPFVPGQPLRRLRSHGEQSIVGLVRWIGDSAEPSSKILTQ